MLHHPEQVLECLLKFSKEIKLKRSIEGVVFREDYGDYRVYMEGNFHIEIREKLIDTIITQPQHADTRRDVAYLLNNVVMFEEWEDDGVQQRARGEAGIQIDLDAD